jgi:hypothetical protein
VWRGVCVSYSLTKGTVIVYYNYESIKRELKIMDVKFFFLVGWPLSEQSFFFAKKNKT